MKRLVFALTSLVASVASYAQGNFKFVEEKHDFGKIPEGPQVEYIFEYTNIGDKPLTVSSVSPSCGCTIPDWSKDPVAPGGKGFIKAIYNTQNRVGMFNKSLTIYSDAIEPNKVIFFVGEVIAKPAQVDSAAVVAPVKEEVKKEEAKTAPASKKTTPAKKGTSAHKTTKGNGAAKSNNGKKTGAKK